MAETDYQKVQSHERVTAWLHSRPHNTGHRGFDRHFVAHNVSHNFEIISSQRFPFHRLPTSCSASILPTAPPRST